MLSKLERCWPGAASVCLRLITVVQGRLQDSTWLGALSGPRVFVAHCTNLHSKKGVSSRVRSVSAGEEMNGWSVFKIEPISVYLSWFEFSLFCLLVHKMLCSHSSLAMRRCIWNVCALLVRIWLSCSSPNPHPRMSSLPYSIVFLPSFLASRARIFTNVVFVAVLSLSADKLSFTYSICLTLIEHKVYWPSKHDIQP